MSSDDERLDPVAAADYARKNPRAMKYPPHWLRCEWMRGKERCTKGEGHAGPHAYEEGGGPPKVAT